MYPLFVCALNLVCTALVFHALRMLARVAVPRDYRILVEEFISTMDFCCACCEMAVMCDTYGTIVYGISLFLMCLWWAKVFGDTSANPNTYIEEAIRRKRTPSESAKIILIQLLAGSLVFTYMRYLWSFGWSPLHVHKTAERDCQADLQVSVRNGALVEGVITFIDRINGLTLEEMDWNHSLITSAALSTMLVISALNYSGGYFNPVLASSLKFGCKGHSFLEFLAVYWLGSIAGSLLALTLHRFLGVKKIITVTSNMIGRGGAETDGKLKSS